MAYTCHVMCTVSPLAPQRGGATDLTVWNLQVSPLPQTTGRVKGHPVILTDVVFLLCRQLDIYRSPLRSQETEVLNVYCCFPLFILKVNKPAHRTFLNCPCSPLFFPFFLLEQARSEHTLEIDECSHYEQ